MLIIQKQKFRKGTLMGN